MIRSVYFIGNPYAGNFKQSIATHITDNLRNANIKVVCSVTNSQHELDHILRVATTYDAIAIYGGDGTINEIISILCDYATPPPLILIPGGTVNVLCKELNIDLSPAKITEVILKGISVPLYLGSANQRPFTLMASVGFDAAIVHKTPVILKSLLGRYSYILVGLLMATFYRNPNIRLCLDGRKINCKLVVFCNSCLYGGNYLLAPNASVRRPGLYVFAIQDDSLKSLIKVAYHLLTNQISSASNIVHENIIRASVESDEPVYAQIDGEAFGQTPLSIKVSDRSLRILINM